MVGYRLALALPKLVVHEPVRGKGQSVYICTHFLSLRYGHNAGAKFQIRSHAFKEIQYAKERCVYKRPI